MIFELTLGFILAALFVIAYLTVRRLWRGDENLLTGDVPNVSLRPADHSNALGAGTGPRALSAPQPVEDSKVGN